MHVKAGVGILGRLVWRKWRKGTYYATDYVYFFDKIHHKR